MSDLFYKPYLGTDTHHFPYSRETLLQKPIFPALVLDCGAYLCANDILGSANGDVILEKILDGSLFDYWREDGEFDWCAVFKRCTKTPYTKEWEADIFIARLYILLPIAQAYAKTHDKKYANIWFQILNHWRENNPYCPPSISGALTWKDMQMSWRLVSMIYGVYFLGEDNALEKEQWEIVYDMIRQHAAILLPELDKDMENQNTSNHVTLKAMALTMAGILLPELCDAADTIESVRNYTAFQLNEKYYPDGTSREFGHTYRFFTTRLYLELELTLTKNGYAPIDGCAERIQKSYEFLYQFCAPNDMCPQIGDSYALNAEEEIEFVNSFYPLTFPREKKSVLFREGQMAVLRNGKFTLLVEAMPCTNKPAGFSEYTTHIHYGRFQYLLYANDEPLVLDSGCPNYDRAAIYIPLATEPAHNIISCDEVMLHTPETMIRTGATESPEILEYIPDRKLSLRNHVIGTDGRCYTWFRTFEMDENTVTVTDEVQGNGKYHYNSYLHLPPRITGYSAALDSEMHPMRSNKKLYRLRLGSKFMHIETDSPMESLIQPYCNEENRLDYCQVMTRKFYAEHFIEKTVIRF